MEETLTDCLVRVREDLSQLKKVRDYLELNAETEENCIVTWRTIEAFNSILSVCSSQNSPETTALDTLLDSFFYLARNNTNNSVWDDFGFELGIICVKVLSAIERTNIFEVLLCKLLSVISIISEHNVNVWKGTARQILNVLINKKFNLPHLETILKLYISILRNIDSDALYEFSSQNLHLLKTLSLLVQKIGDFEIQSDITELIYLHLSKDPKLMSDIFDKENLTDFENGSRLYLNSLNKSRRGGDRKVYSICCHVMYLGGCFVEPPVGSNFIWVDANKDTERVSIKCDDSESESSRVLYIPFAEIFNIQFENEKTEGNRCLTIQTKNLFKFQKDVSNDDICLVTENVEGVREFVQFLESEVGVRRKKKKTSKTMDSLLIDRESPKKEVQNNAITSSERPGVDQVLPDAMSLFEKANQTGKELKEETNCKTSQERKTGSQELSPNSFVESLNKHIGLGSPELRRTFEDSIETIEFLQKNTPKKSHKLFRSPDKIFNILETNETENFNFIFEEDKENNPPEESKSKIKTYSRKSKTVKRNDDSFVFKNIERKSTNSQECFRGSSVLKKKPFLPKLKRSRKARKDAKPTEKQKGENDEKQLTVGKVKQHEKTLKKGEEDKSAREDRIEKKEYEPKKEAKPSLLDPKGYAYQRWCKPTTSERSNFWLKKLEALQQPKTNPERVFDFSEESDSTLGKTKKKKVVHSKRKCKTKKETKQTSLREVREILKKTSPVKEKKSPKETTRPSEGFPHPQESHPPSKRSKTPESKNGDSEYESVPSSEDEEPVKNKKRERSDEETSSAKGCIKKKPKISIPKNLLSSLRRRMEKREEKDRRYTDEIIRTADKAMNHLFNHLQRKDGERFISYLNTVDEVSMGFEPEMEELNLRAARIQRAVLYFKAGCSVFNFCEFFDCNFSKVRGGLRNLRGKKDTGKTIEKVCDRLSRLIEIEIEKSCKAEWVLKRNRLLKCASILGGSEPEP